MNSKDMNHFNKLKLNFNKDTKKNFYENKIQKNAASYLDKFNHKN